MIQSKIFVSYLKCKHGHNLLLFALILSDNNWTWPKTVAEIIIINKSHTKDFKTNMLDDCRLQMLLYLLLIDKSWTKVFSKFFFCVLFIIVIIFIYHINMYLQISYNKQTGVNYTIYTATTKFVYTELKTSRILG